MKIFVIGDQIIDQYFFGTATRLCPEAPVPVLVPSQREERPGGAALVAAQITALGGNDVLTYYGSSSRKERYFSGGHLMLRVDYDRLENPCNETTIISGIIAADIVVISDYDKGTFTPLLASRVMDKCECLDIPVFVDSKNNWHWFTGAFCMFPNAVEGSPRASANHVIKKMGENGCYVDDTHVPLVSKVEVRDTTGAGDIFMAAFVVRWSQMREHPGKPSEILGECARFANQIASESVRHVGSYVVIPKEAQK